MMRKLICLVAACSPTPRPGHGDGAPPGCQSVCLSNEVSRACLPDNTGTVDERCDPAAGAVCDPGTGRCTTPCGAVELGRSYIGCEYYPTVVANTVSTLFDFAVAVGNTYFDTATVTIDGGGLVAPVVFDVPPNQVVVKSLPWVPELKACVSTGIECDPAGVNAALVAHGAYHVTSTRPVTVYQFNPLQYHQAFRYSMANDAALLLPVNALGLEHVVVAWPAWTKGWTRPGLVAVTAAIDNTKVTVTTT